MTGLKRFLIIAAIGGGGLLSGFAAKRSGGGDSRDAGATGEDIPRAGGRAGDERSPLVADGRRGRDESMFQPSTLRSADTLEDLKQLDDRELYGRLALWMMDASEAEIADFWNSYKGRENLSNDIIDLTMIQWSRLDPQGAIAAVSGTNHEHYAWWAWACHDPETALAAAIRDNPARMPNVAWGIGEFHPAWARAHFDEIPEEGRGNLLQGMAKWDDGEDPQEALDFLKSHGYGTDPGTLRLLVRKDPWAAYEWLQKNGSDPNDYRSAEAMNTFMKTVASEHPEMLERLAYQTPPGEMKRRMESALFRSLVASDPEAAMEAAGKVEAPRVAAERWAELGSHWMASDPERAFEVAGELFASAPNALSMSISVMTERGGTSWGQAIEGVDGFVEGLIAKDPARVMEVVSEAAGENLSGVRAVAEKWAQRDLAEFADWASTLEDSPVRNQAAGVMVSSLSRSGRYDEAIDWALSTTDENTSKGQLINLYYQWNSRDPEQARTWLESAELPDAQRRSLETFAERFSRADP